MPTMLILFKRHLVVEGEGGRKEPWSGGAALERRPFYSSHQAG